MQFHRIGLLVLFIIAYSEFIKGNFFSCKSCIQRDGVFCENNFTAQQCFDYVGPQFSCLQIAGTLDHCKDLFDIDSHSLEGDLQNRLLIQNLTSLKNKLEKLANENQRLHRNLSLAKTTEELSRKSLRNCTNLLREETDLTSALNANVSFLMHENNIIQVNLSSVTNKMIRAESLLVNCQLKISRTDHNFSLAKTTEELSRKSLRNCTNLLQEETDLTSALNANVSFLMHVNNINQVNLSSVTNKMIRAESILVNCQLQISRTEEKVLNLSRCSPSLAKYIDENLNLQESKKLLSMTIALQNVSLNENYYKIRSLTGTNLDLQANFSLALMLFERCNRTFSRSITEKHFLEKNLTDSLEVCRNSIQTKNLQISPCNLSLTRTQSTLTIYKSDMKALRDSVLNLKENVADLDSRLLSSHQLNQNFKISIQDCKISSHRLREDLDKSFNDNKIFESLIAESNQSLIDIQTRLDTCHQNEITKSNENHDLYVTVEKLTALNTELEKISSQETQCMYNMTDVLNAGININSNLELCLIREHCVLEDYKLLLQERILYNELANLHTMETIFLKQTNTTEGDRKFDSVLQRILEIQFQMDDLNLNDKFVGCIEKNISLFDLMVTKKISPWACVQDIMKSNHILLLTMLAVLILLACSLVIFYCLWKKNNKTIRDKASLPSKHIRTKEPSAHQYQKGTGKDTSFEMTALKNTNIERVDISMLPPASCGSESAGNSSVDTLGT